MSEVEFDVMVNYLQQNSDIINLGILMMFVTGVRVGELVAFRWSDVDSIGINIRRTESCYKDKKGTSIYTIKEYPKLEAGIRTAIIPRDYMWIIKELRRLNPFGEYIFVKSDNRITTKQVRRRLDYLCEIPELMAK